MPIHKPADTREEDKRTEEQKNKTEHSLSYFFFHFFFLFCLSTAPVIRFRPGRDFPSQVTISQPVKIDIGAKPATSLTVSLNVFSLAVMKTVPSRLRRNQ